jgi:ABC-type multidrug transport system fused ATPase/permease subunit
MSLDSLVFQFLSAVASLILVCTGSVYILAAIPFCIIALGLIQFYYLRTSRQMRLLDIEAKAPLFSQFLETLHGVESIRAYGWTQDYLDRNVRALNNSQKPYYLMGCIQRWLTLVLDLLNAGLAVLLVIFSTTISNGSTGVLGVALYNILTLCSAFQALIKEWTQVEIALGAIRRVRSYVLTVKDENLPDENGELPDHWPTEGQITFNNVSASYKKSLGPVLSQVNLTIEAGESIAICGRTGRYVYPRMLRLRVTEISIN